MSLIPFCFGYHSDLFHTQFIKKNMKVKILKHSNELLEIKEVWDKLFNLGEYTVFQSFDYCYNSALTSDIYIICLFENDVLVELWPLEIVKNRLRFINDIHDDFCDILSSCNSTEVISFLEKEESLGRLSFRNLTKDALVLKKINSIPFFDISKSINYSILNLENTNAFPANFNHFVYRQKRRLKRILKKYTANHSFIEVKSNAFPYADIVLLRNKMLALKMRKNTFLDDSFLMLVESLYLSGKLIVSKIEIDGEVVALSLLFKSKNKYSFWVDLYNDLQMINLYHNVVVIKNCTFKSDAIFNFGRGAYNYKIQNFQPELFSLFEYNSFNSSFGKSIFTLKKRIINLARKTYKINS